MKKLDIIYEDKKILVISKEPHILTISDGKTNNTLYHEVREYLRKKNQNVFIVHRLDKDTSGVILFAKDEKIKRELQDNWNDITKREYIAVVSGCVKEDKKRIVQYLKENKEHFMYEAKDGKKAITNYEVIYKSKGYSILRILIETGLKNQIRFALASIGHPIIGDSKYEGAKSPVRRMMLHASKLEIVDPRDKIVKVFEAKLPSAFKVYKGE